MSKLLLVEDDNNLREIYEARLQAEGYEIVSATDGEEALVVAKAEKPDLIISDVMMPKISGFEMLDILRNTDELRTVKVIMLTALGQNDDQARADRLGADRYLVKSQVTLEDIVKVAHELLADEQIAAEETVDTITDTSAPAEPVPAPEPVVETPAPEPIVEAPAPEPVVAEPVATEPAPAPEPESTPEPVVEIQVTEAPIVQEPEPIAVEPVPETPAPEPVVEAPAPEPVVAEPVATEHAEVAVEETVATPPISTPDPQPVATSDDQIENFVAGATSVPNQPLPEPATVITPQAATPTITVTSSTETQASTDVPAEPVAPAQPITAGSAAIAADPATAEPISLTGGKKIITPIDVKPKTDLNELVAAEDAKEQPAPAVVTPEAVISDDPEDPSNIAL